MTDGTTNVAENVSTLTVAIDNGKTFAAGQTVTLTFGGSAVYGTDYGVSPVDADANATGHQVLLPAETASVQVTVTAADNSDRWTAGARSRWPDRWTARSLTATGSRWWTTSGPTPRRSSSGRRFGGPRGGGEHGGGHGHRRPGEGDGP